MHKKKLLLMWFSNEVTSIIKQIKDNVYKTTSLIFFKILINKKNILKLNNNSLYHIKYSVK